MSNFNHLFNELEIDESINKQHPDIINKLYSYFIKYENIPFDYHFEKLKSFYIEKEMTDGSQMEDLLILIIVYFSLYGNENILCICNTRERVEHIKNKISFYLENKNVTSKSNVSIITEIDVTGNMRPTVLLLENLFIQPSSKLQCLSIISKFTFNCTIE